jgi:hypothetical protein
MAIKRCLACGDALPLSSRVPDQSYCARPECQRERRKLWQRERRQLDGDYRDKQSKAQKAWSQTHADYWSRYRELHPEYVERNRAQQQIRNAFQRKGPVIAKMNASAPPFAFPSGTYRLELKDPEGVAKMDAFTAEITVLTRV